MAQYWRGVGHSVLAISNVIKGLQRLDIAADVIAADLESNWEVLGGGHSDGYARRGNRGHPRHGEPL